MRRILIENGLVVDGLGAKPARQSVLIEGGRIAAVGAAISLPEGGADVTRIDAAGMTVMPGLIDAHCHITFDEPLSNDELFFHRREGLAALIAGYNVQKVLRAGVTGIFDADSIFSLGVDLRDAIEAGIVEGPRMTAGGNAMLTSVGGAAGNLLPDEGRRGYARITPTRDEIIAETRRQIKYGVDWVKVHVTGLVPRHKERGEIQVWNFDELRAVVDTAHDLGIPVVGHCRNASSTRDAARAGFDMILHATFMDEEALEAVVEAQVPLVPTLTFQANLADYGDLVGADPALQDIFKREIEGSSVMLRRAYDAGVPLLSGTESGFALTPYGHWHWRELDVFVKYMGLTPLEAIRAATSEGARALGLYGKTGQITPGCMADVIVVKGDVSRDVSLLGEPERLRHILLGGREIDLSRPLPDRTPIPGWRVSPFAVRHLTRDVVQKGDKR